MELLVRIQKKLKVVTFLFCDIRESLENQSIVQSEDIKGSRIDTVFL